jgi:peptide/nickel transport system permease protein
VIKLIAKRLVSMLVIMFIISLIIFTIFDSDKMKAQIATSELGGFQASALIKNPEAYAEWQEKNGLNKTYTEWASGILKGDFGHSREKNTDVGPLLAERLGNTGILAGLVFLFMIPIALVLGVIAGMKEGSIQDRVVTFISVLTTSIPEIATAVFLIVIFGLFLKWFPLNAAMNSGWDWSALVLPVMALVIYDFGYVARMTRASMADVMQSHYIRTAVLKGLPKKRVILKHALRNALIAPFTVIVLQINWLLSGVVVIEVIFEYDGFGKLLLQAALFGDVDVIQAATLVAVFVAVFSQIISDVGYTLLNPRIRF